MNKPGCRNKAGLTQDAGIKQDARSRKQEASMQEAGSRYIILTMEGILVRGEIAARGQKSGVRGQGHCIE